MCKIDGSCLSWLVRTVLDLEIVRQVRVGREHSKKGKDTMPLTQEWNTKPGQGNERSGG